MGTARVELVAQVNSEACRWQTRTSMTAERTEMRR
jgi:hypothetical protein